ncbi:uncharacterized protein A1O9_09454 [Exophiala aquamarina CBS 119918]|uniref:Uncharacterized protein n=1 Tax=Exophiala aquamarina CBS 119918 TaxID=1182545 RepID=A0A072P4X2_9EURO|nr:uncharacterized protein A1O9_09454 [Exophiala aquamarina CBS 119918]KEF54288.1 hypothetical protein A1O9_09454 [Exophiala aquamarina CBS 119918]
MPSQNPQADSDAKHTGERCRNRSSELYIASFKWVEMVDMCALFCTQLSPSSSMTRRGRLKFLVTSRPYDDIQAEFQKTRNDLPTIRLRGEDENDQIHEEIDMVIRMRVPKLALDFQLNGQTKD